MEWLFLSFDDQSRTMSLLLGQDPGFSCYSMMSRDWGFQGLRQGAADDFSPDSSQEIENGHSYPSRWAHIAKDLPTTTPSALSLQGAVRAMRPMGKPVGHCWKRQSLPPQAKLAPSLGSAWIDVQGVRTDKRPRKGLPLLLHSWRQMKA